MLNMLSYNHETPLQCSCMHEHTCEDDVISIRHILHKESQGNSSTLDLDT